MKAIFQDLYDRYHQDLYQFIYYMVKNRTTAEDLVQEVYIKVFKSYDTFKGESSPKTWMFSIARHVTIDFFRKEERRQNRSADYYEWHDHDEQLSDVQPLPDEIAEKMKKFNCSIAVLMIVQKINASLSYYGTYKNYRFKRLLKS